MTNIGLIISILYYLVCIWCFIALRKRIWYDEAAKRGYRIALLNAIALPFYVALGSFIITFPIEGYLKNNSVRAIEGLIIFLKIFFVFGFLFAFWIGEMGGFLFLFSPVFCFQKEIKGFKFEDFCKYINASASIRRWARDWFRTWWGIAIWVSFFLLIMLTFLG